MWTACSRILDFLSPAHISGAVRKAENRDQRTEISKAKRHKPAWGCITLDVFALPHFCERAYAAWGHRVRFQEVRGSRSCARRTGLGQQVSTAFQNIELGSGQHRMHRF